MNLNNRKPFQGEKKFDKHLSSDFYIANYIIIIFKKF